MRTESRHTYSTALSGKRWLSMLVVTNQTSQRLRGTLLQRQLLRRDGCSVPVDPLAPQDVP
jgi:hypothetical protein